MAEEVILGFLKENDEIADSGEFAASVAVDHDNLINVIKSLNGLRIVDAQDIKREKWVLTDEGKSYTVSGSPEVQFFHAVPPEGIFQDELQKKIDSSVYKIGCAQAMRNKWVQTQKLQEMGKIQVSRKVQHVEDSVKDLLLSIKDGKEIGPADVDVLKKRKLIALQTWKGYSLRKGPNYVTKRTKPVTDLTREHLQRFWNFDALFQPQQHPARDSHDTFFLQVPSTTKRLPEDYVDRVKRVHESGGYGSKGYGYEWKRDEANKNLLRTHTTSVLSRMLYLLAQKPFSSKRYFSIDVSLEMKLLIGLILQSFTRLKVLYVIMGLHLGI